MPAVALQLCLQFSSKLFTAGRVCFSTYYSKGFAVVSGSALYFEEFVGVPEQNESIVLLLNCQQIYCLFGNARLLVTKHSVIPKSLL